MSSAGRKEHNDKIAANEHKRELSKAGTIATRKQAKHDAEVEAQRAAHLAQRAAERRRFEDWQRENTIRKLEEAAQAADDAAEEQDLADAD